MARATPEAVDANDETGDLLVNADWGMGWTDDGTGDGKKRLCRGLTGDLEGTASKADRMVLEPNREVTAASALFGGSPGASSGLRTRLSATMLYARARCRLSAASEPSKSR